MTRDQILICPVSRGLHELCAEAPPVGARPQRLRWLLYDAGCYPGIRDAYAAGIAGAACAWPAATVFAVAWLAGCDARFVEARVAP